MDASQQWFKMTAALDEVALGCVVLCLKHRCRVVVTAPV